LILGLPHTTAVGLLGAQSPVLQVRGQNLYANGRPVYPFGQGFWQAVVKGGFDFRKEAEWYRPYRANFTRVKTVTTRIVPSASYTPENPWVRLANGKYDLSQFNATFWKRLDDLLTQNGQRGRFVLLQMFDAVTMKKGSEQWDRHPLNPANNINNLKLPGKGQQGLPDVWDVNNKELMDVHQRYLERLLESTVHHKHVIYEICNEYSGTQDFLQFVLGVVRSVEASKKVDLLVTDMPSTAALWDYEVKSPDIELLDFWHAPRAIRTLTVQQIHDVVTSLRASTSKPVLAGRIGPEPDTTNASPHYRRVARAELWAILMAGGVAATTKEDYTGIENGPPAYDVDDQWEAEGFLGMHVVLDNLGHTDVIRDRSDLLATKPFAYTWAATVGQEILAYMGDHSGPGGGSLALRNLAPGRYTAKVFAPDPAQILHVYRLDIKNGQTTIEISPVNRGDRVVWLTPEPFDVTARWEEQNGLRRFAIELRDFSSPVLSYSVFLNGLDVTPFVVPLLRDVSVLPGNGLRVATAWIPFPRGVYELEVWVHGPPVTDRSLLRMRVE